MNLKDSVKAILPLPVLSWIRLLANLGKLRPQAMRVCPVCNYEGGFEIWFGPTLIRDNTCPSCGAHPRHRLFWLWYQGAANGLDTPILHFAPEAVLSKRIRKSYVEYATADLFGDADLRLNIEEIELDSESCKTIICNHVLEHVNDRKALRELCRVLSVDGRLICSVPIAEGWEETYENPSVTATGDRELHFDQADHVRYYGRDFRDRLREAGFNRIEEIGADGEQVVRYGLLRGEKIFVCMKA